MFGRRASFWAAVVGVSVLSPFITNLIARRWPQIGFNQFVSFSNGGSD